MKNIINTQTLRYPMTPHDVYMEVGGGITLPSELYMPDGYSFVEPTEPEGYDPVTEVIEEAAPELVEETWQQVWAVRQKTEAELFQYVSAIKAAKLNAIEDHYKYGMEMLTSGYPLSERESWYVQVQEAKLVNEGSVELTPWITAAANIRKLSRAELATRVLAKDAAYRTIHAGLSATRQVKLDEVEDAGMNLQALQALDTSAGWPVFG